MPLMHYWQVLKDRRRIVIIAFLTTVITTLLLSLIWPAKYEGTATIVLDYDSSNPMNMNMMAAIAMPPSVEYINTQIEIIRSRRIAVGVIDLLGLDRVPQIVEEFNDVKAGNPLFFWRDPKDLDIKVWLADEFLSKYLKVEPARDTRFLYIKFYSGDPKFSAVVANAFAKSYTDHNLELKVAPFREAGQWFASKMKDMKGKSDKATEQLREYQKEKGIITQEGRVYDDAIQRLDQINRDLAAAKTKQYEARVALSRVEQSKGNLESLPEVIGNSLLQSLKAERAKFETQLAEISGKIGTKHPQYIRLQSEIKAVNEKIAAEIQNVVSAIRQEHQSANQRVAQLESAVAGLKGNVLDLNLKRVELDSLSRESDAYKQSYDVVLKKFNETALQGDMNRTNVFLIDPAVAPQNKYSPKIFLNLLLSIFVGLFLGIGLAFLLDFLDDSVKGADELEHDSGLPLLGVIPAAATLSGQEGR